MALDWKSTDWSALASSQVVRGNVLTIIGLLCSVTGHSLPPDMQSVITDDLQVLGALATAIGVTYSTIHRLIAQPEHATIIIPKKDQPTS